MDARTRPGDAPVVNRIFALYLSGLGIFAIAERLTRDAIPSPSAADPGRNRHRTGEGWAKSAPPDGRRARTAAKPGVGARPAKALAQAG